MPGQNQERPQGHEGDGELTEDGRHVYPEYKFPKPNDEAMDRVEGESPETTEQ